MDGCKVMLTEENVQSIQLSKSEDMISVIMFS